MSTRYIYLVPLYQGVVAGAK